MVTAEYAIFQHSFQLVVRAGGNGAINFRGDEFLAFLEQDESPRAGILAGIGYRLLIYVVPFSIDVDRGAFQRETQRVAIDLLEERAAHAEAPVVHGPALASKLGNHILDGVVIHTVALDEADLRRDHLPAFAVDFVPEPLGGNIEDFFEDSNSVAAVRANHQRAFTMQHFVAQLAAP